VLTYELLRHAGAIMRHMVGVLILSWRRMLRAMSVAGLVGLVLAELAGSLITHRFPPGPLTHVVAVVLAAALAYSAALTMLMDELFSGAIATLRVAEGEVSAEDRSLTALAAREAGGAGKGIMRWLDRRPSPERVMPAPHDVTGSSSVARGDDSDVQYEGVTAETLADFAATEEFSNTAPHPRVEARPVRADQFPRIEWAADPTEDSRPHVAVPPGKATSAPMPPIPMRGETQPASPALVSSLAERPAIEPPRTVPVTTTPLAGVEGDGDVSTPSRRTVARGDASQAQEQDRSRSSGRQRPREEAVSGLWSRIGRALVGNMRTPEADKPEDVTVEARDDTQAGP
jgi:hypothetical protein